MGAFSRRVAQRAVSVCLAAPAAVALAQSATPEVQRVEVVGITPLPGLGVPKDQVPANVQTARAADIERSQAADLSGFLARRLGGVHINEVQNNPFQPDVNFRGFTASPLLGTPQGLSVYVDGVRLNQAFGDVVSWDLIPKRAIATVALMPGSNPLFGLNTLGGALAVQTKDGLKNPGTTAQLLVGSHSRVAAEFETGGSQTSGADWYLSGNRFHEVGWRVASPSDVSQMFGKLGLKTAAGRVAISAALADNRLNGNGMQEQGQWANNYRSVLTQPDVTQNQSWLLNAVWSQRLNEAWTFTANAYARRIRTHTTNGDVNDMSFDQAVYLATTSAADRAALAGAGYVGLPTVSENAANTPFPKWRCIAQATIARSDPAQGEPGEKCNGVINTTHTDQTNEGVTAQWNWEGKWGGLAHGLALGTAVDGSRVRFQQGSQLGYLNADRSVTGVGAFGDGVTGGNVDGVPYDTRVDLSARTRTWSLFGSDVVALHSKAHLTLAARYNRSVVHSRDAIVPGGGPGSLDGDHVFSRVNPALGLTFAASPQVTAYAGLNQGSRAPSAVELGCADPANPCKLPNAFAGDPPLKQVVTSTVEAGLRSRSTNDVQWNLGLFRADNRDDILFVADNASGFGYFKNFGRTRRQGLEAGFSTRLGPVTTGANLSLTSATYQTTEVVNGGSNSTNDAADGKGFDGNITVRPGDRIPLIPQRLFKLFAQAQLGAWSLGADFSAVGGSFARGNENNAHQPDGTYYLGSGRSPGYAVFNVNGEWRATEGLTLFGQINNLIDRRYSSAAQLGPSGIDANGNFVGRPFSGPVNADGARPVKHSTFYAPGAPRSLWIGARWAFGGQ